MNKEEKIEKVKCAKHYFVTSFWISFVLLLISSLICIAFYDTHAAMVERLFNLDSEDYSYILVLLMGFWKILIIQFTLIPAIALWMIERNYQTCKK